MPYPSSIETLRRANRRGFGFAGNPLLDTASNVPGPVGIAASAVNVLTGLFGAKKEFPQGNPDNFEGMLRVAKIAQGTGEVPDSPANRAAALTTLRTIANGGVTMGWPPITANPRIDWSDANDSAGSRGGRAAERGYARKLLDDLAFNTSEPNIPGAGVPLSALPATVATALQNIASGVNNSNTIPAVGYNLTNRPPAQAGMSTTTLLLMAGLAVGAVMIATRKGRR